MAFDTEVYIEVKKYIKGNIIRHGIETHIPLIKVRLAMEDYEGAKAIKDAIMEDIDRIVEAMKPHLTPEEIETRKL